MKTYLVTSLFLSLLFFSSCDVGNDSNNGNNVNNVNNTNNTNNVNNVNNANNVNNQDFTVLKSGEARDEDPQIPNQDLETLLQGMTTFHFDVYGQLAVRDTGNIIYSPWSITTALAMTWAGAANDTEAEMADVLYFPMDQALVHTGMNFLDLHLNTPATGNLPFTLNSVNSIWGQKDYEFKAAFLDTLAIHYGAGLNLLDFVTDAEGARAVINAWVASQTADRITELLTQGTLDSLTRLVLVNALYFKAKWQSEFAPDATAPGNFTKLDQTQVVVDMMSQDGTSLPYYEGTGYRAVEMPYVGDRASMLVIMPDAGTFSAFEAALDGAQLDSIIDNLAVEPHLFLTLPKFDFRFNLSLKPVLEALGMEDAFTLGVADFTGMREPLELYISDVVHEAFIGIDEAGTEAGAATAVIMSGYGETVVFTVDQPFLFFIRDRETGLILFAGRVTDPS